MRGMDKTSGQRQDCPEYQKHQPMNAVSAPSPDVQPSDLLAGSGSEPDNAELARWHERLGQVGRELAEPLTAALERVTTLTTTGRIDRAGLRALRDEIDRARQTGIWCQQIARLASGRIRQSQERVHLTNTIQSVLAYRAREMHAQGLMLKQSLLPIEIQADASMLFSLLNALVDWLLDCAHGTVELRLAMRQWPARAQLTCSFQHHRPDEPASSGEALQARVNKMHWHLLEQTARSLGLVFDRQIDPSRIQLHLEFPGTITPTASLDDAHTDAHGFADSVNSKPLAGSHVLVIASRRDLRLQIGETLKSMGLVLDFVGSVREAAEFCREGLPHAIVFESELRAKAFDQLVSGIRQEVPEFVFIELARDGRTFDISTISATGMARVGCEGLGNALPSALVYELSRVM